MARTLSSSYLAVADTADFSFAAGSIALWVRKTSNTGTQECVDARVDGNNEIEITDFNDGSLNLRFNYSGGGVAKTVSVASLALNTWTHLCITWDTTANEMRAYVNGAQVGTTQTALTQGAGTLVNYSIGNDVWNDYFVGGVAEFAQWSVAITAADIAALGKGISPSQIRPASLKDYIPILGVNSPENNLIRTASTITGTAAVLAHPAVFYPHRRHIAQAVSSGAITHATSGTLTGQSSSIVGTSAHLAKHTTTGVLTGPGSTIAGTSVHQAKHTTSGVLTGPGAAIVGTSAHIAKHTTSGVLAGQIGSVAGSAAHVAKHATSGVLTGQIGSIVGVAARSHACTGALIGASSIMVCSAAHGNGAWFPVTASSDTWANVAAASNTWTDVAPSSNTWS